MSTAKASAFPEAAERCGRLVGRQGAASAGELFRTAESPYLSGFLDAELENLMLLETSAAALPLRVLFLQQVRAGIAFADEENLLRAIAWAVEKRIDEVYLLDPP